MERSLLILSSSKESLDYIALAASEYGFDKISVSESGKDDSRKLITQNLYDLVIINTPLSDEYGHELAAFISENSDSAVIVAAGTKSCRVISDKLKNTNAYIIPRPLTKSSLIQAVDFVLKIRDVFSKLKNTNRQLENKIRDLKIINRAKYTLMQYLRISEDEAHKQIVKRAMDSNVSQVSIAEDILRTYEI